MSLQVRITDTLRPGVKKYFKKAGIGRQSKGADMKAKTVMGLTAINFIVNGSPGEPVVPPIMHGILRASGSVFVGSKFVGGNNLTGAPRSESNTSHSAPDSVVTIGFNTAYALKMHETDWMPGPVSVQSGDVGNKFVEKHLKADKEIYLETYAKIFKRETGG